MFSKSTLSSPLTGIKELPETACVRIFSEGIIIPQLFVYLLQSSYLFFTIKFSHGELKLAQVSERGGDRSLGWLVPVEKGAYEMVTLWIVPMLPMPQRFPGPRAIAKKLSWKSHLLFKRPKT